MKKSSIVLITILSLSLIFTSCSVLNTITNLQKLKFKLNGISDFKVSGVSLSGKSSISDFGFADALKLKNLLSGNSFPVQFILDLEAYNPNDGKTTPVKTDATISNMQWWLYIDNVQTISGNIASPITVPATGQSIVIPLTMNLDLYTFFKDKGLNRLLELAFSLGGIKSDLTHVKLEVQPTVQTIFGAISYPGRLTVIDKEYSK
jgi:hypothetical protein